MSPSGTYLTWTRKRPKVVDMNQTETLVAVAVCGLLLLLIPLVIELRSTSKRRTKFYPWPVTGHVALLDMDEWDYELATQDSDQWAAQAYAMYMEDV